MSTRIRRPPAVVWEAVRDIASHPRWMTDAQAIRFRTAAHEGVGTTFECDTRIGPLRLRDVMEVVEWDEGRAIGIRHVGLVTGTGRFTLRRRGPRSTSFSWEERLRFPWWIGGRAAALVVGPLLKTVWRRNLANLRRLVEDG